MIRPFTCACLLLAAGSGLWLYHVKHKAQVLDRRIEHTIRDAEAARQRTTLLRADWALLNDPQRLQKLAASYLQLQPITPVQFVPLARLDSRLPPVPPPPVPDTAPAVIDAPEALVAQATPDAAPHDAPPPDSAAVAAAAPAAPAASSAAKPVRVAEARPPAPPPPAPRAAAPAPIRPRPPVYTAFATQRVVRPPPLHRVDAMAVGSPVARAYTGSVLGAAGPIHLAPPVPMRATYVVNPVVVPDSR